MSALRTPRLGYRAIVFRYNVASLFEQRVLHRSIAAVVFDYGLNIESSFPVSVQR